MDDPSKKETLPRGPWQETMRFSLVMSLLVPVILAVLFRWVFANDAAIIAVAGIFPLIWVLAVYIRRRRVDWIGVIVVICFGAALAASPFAYGSGLPLKIYHPAVTGAVGIIFLVSAAVRRPMLWLFIQSYNISGPDRVERLSNPEVKKKLSSRTVLVGLIFVAEAIVHTVLAIALPVDTYLEFSGAVTVAAALVLITVIRIAALKSR